MFGLLINCWIIYYYINAFFSKKNMYVSLNDITNQLYNNSYIYDLIQIDELNNKAYFHINETLDLNITEYTLSISKYGDFTEKLDKIYGDDIYNVVYKDRQSLSSNIYSFILNLIIIYIFSNILYFIVYPYISKFTNKTNIKDIGANLFGGQFTMSDDGFSINKNVKEKFNDVIGLENVKEDLYECINYFHDRDKYLKHGCNIPRGLLFLGSPGTGKTLLARALAGEANVTFISATGSDFMEMFVGVGARRVKKLFKLAKSNAPAIIFIDEIDSIGRNRNKKHFSHSEQEATLNSLLSEMDGFQDNENVLVIAATNLSKTLDPALTRSGRFDKKIYFDKPNKNERIDMFKLYMNRITLSTDVTNNINDYTNKLSTLTAGLTGADISNIVNQSIMSYMKRYCKKVNIEEKEDFKEIIDKVIDKVIKKVKDEDYIINGVNIEEKITEVKEEVEEVKEEIKDDGVMMVDLTKSIEDVAIGMEKKERLMTEKEKNIVAHHEAGHCLMAYMLEQCTPPIKVSIIPRGEAALGYSQQEPTDQKLYNKEELFATICVLFGGRIAEQIMFSSITTGAADDIEKITDIVNNMVLIFGMSSSIGELNFNDRKLSNNMKNMVDDEISKIIRIAKDTTETILSENKDNIILIAEKLLIQEQITNNDIDDILENNLKNSINIQEYMKYID